VTTLGFEVLLACAAGMLVGWLWPGDARSGLRRGAMTAISAAVLAYWQPRGLVATLVLTLLTWAALRAARDPARRRPAVGAGVGVLVAALIFYKYAGWLLALFPGARGSAWAIGEAPVGLSFTVFRLIGVLLDAVSLKQAVTGGELMLVALFFPTCRSGPITTLSSLGPTAALFGERLAHAVGRIFLGLCRKLLLANNLSTLILTPWLRNGVAGLSPEQCLVLPVLFGLRVYWDFAGYTDIAVGAAALMGYRVPENFDRPYLSRNLVEFWRRWHITLSEWIRLRLFMKLVGRRSPKAHLYAATVVSMALCGLWHGAGWGFLLWGVWHGVGIVGVQLFGDAQRQSESVRRFAGWIGDAAATALTFAYVSLGWLVFFLPLDDAGLATQRAVVALGQPAGWGALALLALAGTLAYILAHREVGAAERWAAVPGFARGVAYALLTWGMVVSSQPEPFIYFRF
jgi:D-alanyl-lipoteichoic acid acyltransferase DltB (MBOAT superfamily)